MSRFTPSFVYGDAVAIIRDSAIYFGVVNAITIRTARDGESIEWEVEFWDDSEEWSTEVIFEASKIADCPTTREAYSEFDELVQSSEGRKNALCRSKKMKSPPEETPIAVLPDVTSASKPTQ